MLTNSKSQALPFALRYLAAGLSIIPIRADGSKAAAVKWEPFTRQLAAESQVKSWFSDDRFGLAVIGGEVSGRLEHLDFDADAAVIFPAWCALVESEAPGLLDRLSVRTTPRDPPGYHVSYRCPEVTIPGNTKLAERPDAENPRKRIGLIETRGEGGYVIVPGSPLGCHASGRPYQHSRGPQLEEVDSIAAAERLILWRCAQSFNQSVEAESRPSSVGTNGEHHLSPGDDYNARGPAWGDILAEWVKVREVAGKAYWRRPGKDGEGWSATTGCRSKEGRELLCVFSSNAWPFPGPSGSRPCSAHDKFGAYTLLHHRGDFSAAAKALAGEGYGEKKRGRKERSEPEAEEPSPPDQEGYAIILDHFRGLYRPVFRRGTSIYSASFGRDVRMSEATAGAGKELIDKLALAANAPRTTDGVLKYNGLPGFFKTWCGCAWVDMLNTLPEEDAVKESDEAAAEEFGRLIRQALMTQITLGETIRGSGKDQVRTERRSLIDWCQRFAKPGAWRPIRSYACWCRQDLLPSGELVVRIAIRHELFSQIGADERLSELKPKRFARLIALYGIGQAIDEERPQGRRAIVLASEFTADMLREPADGQEISP